MQKIARAAVAIIRCLAPNPSILLIERSTHPSDPWSGHLAFPGGGREKSDRHLLDTAIRETFEEVGLTLTLADMIELGPHVTAGHYSGRSVAVCSFVFELRQQPKLNLNPKEVSRIFWLKEEDFLNLGQHKSEAFHEKLKGREFPYFGIEDKKLWGFTYEQLLLFYKRRGKMPYFSQVD